MPTLRIAQAQINTTVGDLARNLDKMLAYVKLAEDRNADILTFPELALCGYPPEDLLLRPGFQRDTRAALDTLIARSGAMAIVVGFPDRDNGRLFNAAAVVQRGRLAAVYHKTELPNYGVFDEERYFARGARDLLLEMAGVRFTLTICEDIWVADSVPERLARACRAALVLNISASPFHAGKWATRLDIGRRFARNTAATLCLNNLVGGQDDLVFDGGSFVISPKGRLHACAERFQETLFVTDVPVAEATDGSDGRDRANVLPVVLETAGDAARAPLTPHTTQECGELEEIYQALVLGTRDYVHKNGFQGVVLGLSGGIDSSLTAALAVAALGAQNVVGVTMPSRFTSTDTRDDAERLAENLRIRLLTLPVGDIYDAYLAVLAESFGTAEPGVAHENIQARIRGNLLMALSNQFGWLVLTTGNKSELAVGYCTLYGDMAGGFAVIKDVPKTQVYTLSEYVNELWDREVIPRTVLERPPSAELRPDQRDEDSLPPYALLDRILERYVERDRSPDEIVAEGFDSDVVQDIIRMVDRSEYKRRQGAPGIKITPKAFGRDRRLPITNRY